MFEKIQLQDGVTLYVRTTNQFKTVNFSVKMKTKLSSQVAASRSVLANVLQDSTEEYPTQTALRNRLDELYGTVFYVDSAKRGDQHMVSVTVECVNDEFLSGGAVFDDVLSLLNSAIFKPNLQDGSFVTEIVNREKRTVIERIRSIYDDKTRYAHQRMLEILRPNHPASVSAYGTEAEVDAVTPDSLLDTYISMIQSDQIDIYVVGHVDVESIVERLKAVFPFEARTTVKRDKMQSEQHVGAEPKHVREQQDMKQGKLHMGFSTPIMIGHPDYPKMQVTNGVYGGFAHSKLFMNVREKESMAYYASSTYGSQYGLIYVLAGIDANLEGKAVSLIKEQLQEMKEGNITDLEIEQTKALLINQLKSAFDSARGQIDIYDQYKEIDESFTQDQLIEQWKQVSKEDITNCASTIQLEVIYLLSGKEVGDNGKATV